MKRGVTYILIFCGALLAGVYLHEFGHAVAGWVQGIAVLPTPAKEYILRSQLDWSKETWIALGGITGTAVAVLIAMLYFWRKPCLNREAVVLGALLVPGVYTLRFLAMGRGHDGTEWQAAQSALGLRPAGHAVDVCFLCLVIAGLIVWGLRLRPTLWAPVRLIALAVIGTILLVELQIANNDVFDRVLHDASVINVPPGLDPR